MTKPTEPPRRWAVSCSWPWRRDRGGRRPLYRYVRNPMYLAVATVIVGQALLLGRWVLLVYALFFVAIVATFVRLYEEPVLTRRFGERYDEYRRAVPAWRPRARPWWPPVSTE